MINQLKDRTLFKQACFVNGRWEDATSVTKVTNPIDDSLIGYVPDLNKNQVLESIELASKAMATWSATTAKERSSILQRWYSLIIENVDDLALIMTSEQGKPLYEARGEITYAASFIQWFAEEGKRIYGDVIPATIASNRIHTIQQPIGVCGAVTPWNFPAAMITRKAAPALAAGCSIVIKPATETPFTALALCELASRAGLPDGLINVITGNSRMIGEQLTTHPLIAKFSFTGSTEVGRILQAQCASTIKKTSMELGGNAPFIVFDDANIEKAVDGLMAAKFRNGGQTCVCVNRIYVHEKVYDEFYQAFKDKASQLVVGKGTDIGVTVGPMINQAAITNMTSLLKDAQSKGATVEPVGILRESGGNYFSPVLVSDVTDDMNLVHDEIFGPIASIIKFSDEEEVIKRANNTIFGLAAYFYTTNINRVYRVSEKIESGMVGVNTGIISNEVAPFGGVKQSGLGKEGSKYGISDYLEIKYVCVDLE
ncbi:NAD-dependent succinate-semialdehyde dehydrogenase [Vibrio tapetis]|uniref:Succinate-semialdehyde dehydrogenase I, NADP-dependent n=1 Tax=Vibrio tapetis subsp. tapetis TaxID=1671868 RepID=A0A2N8ZHH4_9VIBR|nr:NAD-dependent succinate-semialdehyde dehydrogenase [Vibrio tapetis]SON51316.1 succinate-semialdehyde dehydrogenase I, NADP-dependent [Vibrio tapetis subsp. tapetis]